MCMELENRHLERDTLLPKYRDILLENAIKDLTSGQTF